MAAGAARRLLRRVDRDDPAAAADGEADLPRGARVERVVLAHADALAGLEAAAALAHDDLAAAHVLTGEDLHAEALCVGVAAVAARPEALLMRHPNPPWARRPPPRASVRRRACRSS